MTVQEGIELFRRHQQSQAREKTRESYAYLLRTLEALLGEKAIDGASAEDIHQPQHRCRPGCLIPGCIQKYDPSLRQSTSGGSEAPHPHAGTRAYYGTSRKAIALAKHPGRKHPVRT